MIEEVWKETGGEKPHLEKEEEWRRKMEQMEAGLCRCPVCRGQSRIVLFGSEGNGVWVGCDRTERCSRYIEIHTGGWSVEDTVRDWNRRNSGIYGAIRRVKMLVGGYFGKDVRAERRGNREKEAKKRAAYEKRCEVFGIKSGNGKKKWWKIW